jgi:hypothetical protein
MMFELKEETMVQKKRVFLRTASIRNWMMTLILSMSIFISSPISAQEWWKKWDSYPKVPKILVSEVKTMMLAGENIVFVYAGYRVDEIVCGSFYIPYTKVPPSSDGSSVNFRFPKDYWIMCY